MSAATERAPLREVQLPRGRLVVRPVRPDDADGLGALYGRLSLEDRYHRFFSVYYPSADFLDRQARVHEEGGDGLVAVLDDGRIVGEANYFLLPGGAGDFAITVAADWRGWLAPYLLDALAQRAGARGVPSLQADILLENSAMLALVRARGFVTLDHTGPVVRVAIGTSERMPRWSSGHDRRRLLVESPNAYWRAEADAREAGFQVAVCPGAGAHCPVLSGQQCPLAAGADAIMLALDLDDARAQTLPAAHRACHPAVPLCVEVPSTTGGASLPLPSGAVPVERGTPNAELIALLERLTGARSASEADCDR